MQADAAHIDFETASACDLKKAGTARYMEHPTTRVWGFCWRIGSGAVYQWRPGYPDPQPLLDHVARGGKVVAHKAVFERLVWNWILRVRYGLAHWPVMQITQQSCTMARAFAMHLPGKLEKLAIALALEHQKDMAGNAVMLKMMRPRKIYDNGDMLWWDGSVTSNDASVILRYEDPKGEGASLLNRNMEYCEADVYAESEADDKLPELTPSEQIVWQFDQRINERGVLFDMAVVDRADELVTLAKKSADLRMARITNGAVRKVSEVGKLVDWINAQGVPCTSVKKGTFKELIFNADITDNVPVKNAVKLRKETSKTSTAKYSKMKQCVSADGRIRFMVEYHAAHTGRWAGRTVQPQNFVRFDSENEEEALIVGWLVGLLRSDTPIQEVLDTFESVHGEALPWLAKALRSMMVAEAGKIFKGGDFSNIEGRVNTYLAGEQWKLDAFSMYDLGIGPDLYKVAYAKSFGCSVEEVTKPKRQVGKVEELASGYQGGVGAYISMSEQYDLEVYELATTVREGADPSKWAEVESGYENAKDKHGLRKFEWTALKLLVVSWRASHPCIVQSWWDYQDAAIAAVADPGTVYDVADMSTRGNFRRGMVRYMCDKNFLYCCLPSGRVISYAQPFIKREPVTRVRADGTEYEQVSNKLCFWGENSKTKQWQVGGLYGGLLCENVVQAMSRDIMVESMFRVEQAGYPVVLTVHDEILTEPPIGYGSVDEFKRLMSVLPSWAAGLPLEVAAWEDERYVK